jgi:hypothetical protein
MNNVLASRFDCFVVFIELRPLTNGLLNPVPRLLPTTEGDGDEFLTSSIIYFLIPL